MKKLFLIICFPFFVAAQAPDRKNSDSTGTKSEIENPKEQTRKLLESYRERILKGEEFGKLAKLYSQDPGSAKHGGTIVNVERGVMVPEFEEVVFRLKQGEISEIFETQFGFHIVQLLRINGEKRDVRHILLSFPK